MRTYSHALLTLAAARAASRGGDRGTAVAAVAGSVLPDLPAGVAGVWLLLRHRRLLGRREFCERACERGPFGPPDAALHSAVPVLALLALVAAAPPSRRRTALVAALLGWAGHVAADALTHADDARAPLWPVSGVRWRSPVSYWDPSRHGRPLAALEHGVLLGLVLLWARRWARRGGA